MRRLRVTACILLSGTFAFISGTWYATHTPSAEAIYLVLAAACAILAIAQ